jgi:predicted RNA binding protein YcfA (HicA-like mRNA interferase family)
VDARDTVGRRRVRECKWRQSHSYDDGSVPKARDAMKLLAENGWVLKRVRGSHRQFGHPARPGIVTVAGKPSSDLAPGTWQAILRQAGIDDQRSR